MNLKAVIIALSVSACLSVPAIAQKGFTSKADAKNVMKKGMKDGNWIEYMDNEGKATTDTAAPYYNLVVYKKGMKNGLQNQYAKGGKLLSSMPYKNDKLNGVAKYYNSDGKLTGETSFKDNNLNGVQKTYYESGKVKSQTTWTNNQPGATQNFPDSK
jgi:antitoxin component YwqK of YwqJK toxin-antitoxin module